MMEITILVKVVIGLIAIPVLVKVRFRMRLSISPPDWVFAGLLRMKACSGARLTSDSGAILPAIPKTVRSSTRHGASAAEKRR